VPYRGLEPTLRTPACTLVTGGSGFIGSHVVDRLTCLGGQVVVVDNFDPFYARSQKEANMRGFRDCRSVTFYEADICDFTAMETIFAAHDIDAVIHLAARPGVRASVGESREYTRTNINGSVVIFELAARSSVSNVVAASSSSVYTTTAAPFRESDPADRPYSPYGATKRAMELLAHTHAHLSSLPVTCLRFFCAYGPRLRPDLVMQKFASIIDDGRELPIYGDGTSERDYTYIDDIVDGVIAALQRPQPYVILNLGNSRPTPLLELVSLLERLLGKAARRRHLPANPSDVFVTCADTSEATRLLGYHPKISLEDGVAAFVRWYRTHGTTTV
jgi:UDP-glucuronate 4-epimerase